MKRFVLAAAIVLCAAAAQAQYPYVYAPAAPGYYGGYAPYVQPYVPPVRYNYSYVYIPPSSFAPRGMSIYQNTYQPAYPNPYYQGGYNYGISW